MKVDNALMQEAVNKIKAGIITKLDASKKMIDYDSGMKEFAAGVYMYALEELGKLEVIKGSSHNNNYVIDYYNQFIKHPPKFLAAFNYLKQVNHLELMYLSKGFSPKSLSDKSFVIALMAQNQARAGIFYLDFDYDKTTDTATKIKEIPKVDINMLRSNIAGLEELIKNHT